MLCRGNYRFFGYPLWLLAGIAALPATEAVAQDAAAAFFCGRTITITVGFGPGGSYDYYPRVFSRFIGRYIPGNPTVFVQNMPGAGSLTAANHLYNVTPKYGTQLGVVTQTLMLEGPFGTPGVKFNAVEFSYICLTGVLEAMVVWHEAKAKSIHDIREIETIAGGNGSTSVTEGYPRMLNAFAGTKFKIVSGYNAIPQLMLAMERREIDAAESSWASIVRNNKHWLIDKKIHVLVQSHS